MARVRSGPGPRCPGAVWLVSTVAREAVQFCSIAVHAALQQAVGSVWEVTLVGAQAEHLRGGLRWEHRAPRGEAGMSSLAAGSPLRAASVAPRRWR